MLDTPADLWAQFDAIKAVNPIAASNFAVVNRLHDVPRPAKTVTPETETDPRLVTYREASKINPVVASEHAFASGLFRK